MTDYAYGAPAPALPQPLRAVRVLLYVTAAITLLTTVGFLMAMGADAETVGYALWALWPGVAALLIARALPRGGVTLFRLLIALECFTVFLALAALGRGEPRGLTNLILPVTVLLLATRPSSKAFFRRY